MQKEVHICQGRNKSKGYVGMFLDWSNGSSRRNCDKKASIFENEKWYCKRHSPSVIKARRQKSEETYNARIRRNLEENKDI